MNLRVVNKVFLICYLSLVIVDSESSGVIFMLNLCCWFMVDIQYLLFNL